jgi:hypothetical protein
MIVKAAPNVAAAALNHRWGLATVEVIHARRAYLDLTSNGEGNEATVSAAWLRWWRAEERQRQLSAQFELTW